MTNTNPESFPSTSAAEVETPEVETPEVETPELDLAAEDFDSSDEDSEHDFNSDEDPTPAAFIDTPVDLAAEWAQPGSAYRYLSWVARTASRAYSVNLGGFSVARQEGVRDLVAHGLVSERKFTGGSQDGRVSYRVTDEGRTRLQLARDTASLVVIG